MKNEKAQYLSILSFTQSGERGTNQNFILVGFISSKRHLEI